MVESSVGELQSKIKLSVLFYEKLFIACHGRILVIKL